LLLVCFFINIE